jgi:hypothetical protein
VSFPLEKHQVDVLLGAITTHAALSYMLVNGWEPEDTNQRDDGVRIHWLENEATAARIIMQEGDPRYIDASERIHAAIKACARVERRCECAVMLEMLAMSLGGAAR